MVTLRRRDVLKATAAGAALITMPAITRAAGESTLTFVPHADLAYLDPVWTTADITRNF
jgi:peptide/nickel transport system substrate-binding protein